MNPGASGFSLYTNVDILIGNIPLQPMFNKIQPHDGFAGGFNIPGKNKEVAPYFYIIDGYT